MFSQATINIPSKVYITEDDLYNIIENNTIMTMESWEVTNKDNVATITFEPMDYTDYKISEWKRMEDYIINNVNNINQQRKHESSNKAQQILDTLINYPNASPWQIVSAIDNANRNHKAVNMTFGEMFNSTLRAFIEDGYDKKEWGIHSK